MLEEYTASSLARIPVGTKDQDETLSVDCKILTYTSGLNGRTKRYQRETPLNRLMVTIKCESCTHNNEFDQPYAYHAGFGNEGFLYNDEGNLTLVWSSFDAAYRAIVGDRKHPWMLTAADQSLLELALRPAPSGGSWRFTNPARCLKCANPIGGPITQTIYYLRYTGSVVTDIDPTARGLKEILLPSLPSASS